MFTLAHLSDPHIGPMPELKLPQLMSKRFFGYKNWKRNRHKIHSSDILSQLVKDIKCQKIDHVALTGDLVNISLPMEFARARDWLTSLGAPEWISVIPGNHDAYVDISFEQGLGLWQPYMMSNSSGSKYQTDAAHFPYLRIHGNIALLGLCSGEVFPPLLARGKLGKDQIQATRELLRKLADDGFYRVIMIHHPPLPGQNIWRKALKERHAFETMLKSVGCELILHGHNHLDMYEPLKTSTGIAHVFGVPSASATGYGHKPPAGYNIYKISGEKNTWKLKVEKRMMCLETGKFETNENLNF